jgi:hypothetical protein
VVTEIDSEMTARLKARAAKAPNAWESFVEEGIGYIEMALEPEIQRIMLRDGPAVLGDPASWPSANGCITAMKQSLEGLLEAGVIADVEPEATARMITGASCYAAQWIANWAITASFPSLADWNLSATYVIYTIFAALSIPFVLRFVKETKGKTLEEMG